MRSHSRFALAVAAVAALTLGACSSPAAEDDPPADSGVVLEHTFGETTVPEDPERVVTLGWGSGDAAVALGVVPVAMEANAYAGDENGLLPWIGEKLDEMGAETPTMIPEQSDGFAYEDIIEADPDVILAVYSGVTEEQYELLSDIAPTVVYPGEAWATPWRDVITTVGEVLGRTDEADDLVADLDAAVAEKAEEHPEFAGKTITAVWDTAGTFNVYRPADPRVQFLFDLGFENAPAVDDLANGDSTFYYTLSYEELDKLQSDVILVFANTEDEAETFYSQPYAQSIPAVAAGATATMTGAQLLSSVSPPTALSLTWGLDSYVDALAEAVTPAG
ncbi:iron-siderophore ABC transporter substrate-binding protein [Okibacterium endophyticum]